MSESQQGPEICDVISGKRYQESGERKLGPRRKPSSLQKL